MLNDNDLPPPPLGEVLVKEGVEVSSDDINAGRDEILTCQGEHVVVYIKHFRGYKHDLRGRPAKGNRFHLVWCPTLDDMKRKNKYERYVATKRKDGLFRVDVRDPDTGRVDEMEAPLMVCRNCLRQLNYGGYRLKSARARNDIWQSFSISKFFADNQSSFKETPRYTDATAPRNEYTSDWPMISESTRRKRGWRCEECQVFLGDHKDLLHCHHIDSMKWNNRPANLKCLCVLCHRQEPSHGNMHVSPHAENTIQRLQKKQSR